MHGWWPIGFFKIIHWFCRLVAFYDWSKPDLCNSGIRRLVFSNDCVQVKRLILMTSVGRKADGSVYLTTSKDASSLWVLVVVELADHPTVFYCNTMPWESPPNLIHMVATCNLRYGLPGFEAGTLRYMHVPANLDQGHVCGNHCGNYPLQTGSGDGGVKAAVCAVTAAMNPHLFKELTGPRPGRRSYLHEAGMYEKYLRKVLISWFMAGEVNMTLLQEASVSVPATCTQDPATPSTPSQTSDPLSDVNCRKRKATDSVHSAQKVSCYSRSGVGQTCSDPGTTASSEQSSQPCSGTDTWADSEFSPQVYFAADRRAQSAPSSCKVPVTPTHSSSMTQANRVASPLAQTGTVAVAHSSTPNAQTSSSTLSKGEQRSSTQVMRSLLAAPSTPVTKNMSVARSIGSQRSPPGSRMLLVTVKTPSSTGAPKAKTLLIRADTPAHTDSTQPVCVTPSLQARSGVQSILPKSLLLPSTQAGASAQAVLPHKDLPSTLPHTSLLPRQPQADRQNLQAQGGVPSVLPRSSASSTGASNIDTRAAAASTQANSNKPNTRARTRSAAAGSSTKEGAQPSGASSPANSSRSCQFCDMTFAGQEELLKHKCRKHQKETSASQKKGGNASQSTAPSTDTSNTETGMPDAQPHSNTSNEVQPGQSGSTNVSKKACPFCDRILSSKQALFSHKKRQHKDMMQPSAPRSCRCSECPDFQCCTLHELIQHHRNVHQQKITIYTKTFPSEQEFKLWMKKMEKETQTCYIKARGNKLTRNFISSQYYCHRSGMSKPTENRKRAFKSQGSSKIGTRCTAFLTARKDLVNGSVSIQYCPYHIGHSLKLCHLRLSKDLKTQVAGKLAQGLEPQQILDDLRATMTDVNRDSLVTKKDITNIRKQFKLSGLQKRSDEAAGTDSWVEELSKEADNPVVFYKPEGGAHPLLGDEDFLVCVQTAFQKNMMVKHALKVICIDSRRMVLSQGDVVLTTLLVIDEFEEALPVAWAVSNREDSEMFKLFFDTLKGSCKRDFKVDIFMSDQSNSSCSAWSEVFSESPEKPLYCPWILEQAWRKQLGEHMQSQKDQNNTYTHLKALQTETDEQTFCKKLRDFHSYLRQKSPAFLSFFFPKYVSNNHCKLWAACYRTDSCAKVSKFADTFQRALKDMDLRVKQNLTVDRLLAALLKLAKDKAVEQLIKLEKGKANQYVREMKNQHKASASIQSEMIQKCSDEEGKWLVPSSAVKGQTHCVKRVRTDPCSCRSLCDACRVCPHIYTCSCSDFLFKAVTCKHIHAVHQKEGQVEEQASQVVEDVQEDVDHVQLFKSMLCQDKPEASGDIQKVKSTLLSVTSDIVERVKKINDIAILQEMFQHLKNAYTVGMRNVGVKEAFWWKDWKRGGEREEKTRC